MAIDSRQFEAETAESGRRNRVRFIIVAAVVVLALGYMIYAAFPGNTLFFLTVSEFTGSAEAQDGRVLKVSGKLVDGTFDRADGSLVSSFQLTDKDEATAGESRLLASYSGVLPDLFFNPHSEIILQGSYGADEVFHADDILVKCPSKYRALEEEPPAASG